MLLLTSHLIMMLVAACAVQRLVKMIYKQPVGNHFGTKRTKNMMAHDHLFLVLCDQQLDAITTHMCGKFMPEPCVEIRRKPSTDQKKIG